MNSKINMKSKSSVGYLSAMLIFMFSCCVAHVQQDIVQVSDAANEEFLSEPNLRPIVRASGNVVNIDDKSMPNEYFGALYIGSEAVRVSVSYDTMSSWTVVTDDFDIYSSATAKQQFVAGTNDSVQMASQSFGPATVLTGPVYKDSFCLIHPGDAGDSGSARLCVTELPFILAPIVEDVNTYQGVLGLSRSAGGRPTYVGLLQSQGIIKDAIVGFNYESPADWSQMSQVAFGEILYSEIEGGAIGTNFYSNLGRDQWGLQIDDFLYNDQDMTNGQRAKIALIDSGNVSIQLPQFVWENVLVSMQHEALGADYRVVSEQTDKGMYEIRIPNKNCEDVIHYLKPIQFKLENTTISLQPSGYTYQDYPKQGYCQIGMHQLKGVANEYRLGTVFLRNFYTALDYDRDLIAIGVNRGSAEHATAGIKGKTNKGGPPFKPKRTSVAGLFIFVLFLVLVIIAVVYFIMQRKDLQKKKKTQDAEQAANDTPNQQLIEEAAGQGSDPESEEDGEEEADDNIMTGKSKAKKKKDNNYLAQSEPADEDQEEEPVEKQI